MDITENYIQASEEALATAYNEAALFLTLSDTYFQILAILLAVGISYGVSKIIRHYVLAVKEPDGRVRVFSKRWFMRRSGRLLTPLLAIVSLTAFEAYLFDSSKELVMMHTAQRLSLIWLLWMALKAYVTSTLVRTVGLWIFVPAASLHLFGWFDPTVDYLNKYGFTIGDVDITAYTFIKAVFIISIIVWLGKVISSSGEGYVRNNTSLTRSTKELLIKLFDIVLYSALFLVTLNLIGIDLTALAVFGGALGVGLGFGLQKVASNFISGLILLTEKSININNLIEMDDGVFGYVRKLGARASVVETFDGKEVMVPNEDFITSRVSNLTHSSTNGRIEIPVGVSYNTDLHLAYELILKAANEYESALQTDEEHKPKCYLREYGDSSVNFLLTFWLEDVTTGRWRAKSDVMFVIWDLFKENNIEIPFPQRDLHIRSGLEKISSESVSTERL